MGVSPGVVIDMVSFLSFPPKMNPASSLNPFPEVTSPDEVEVSHTKYGSYDLISYLDSLFSVTYLGVSRSGVWARLVAWRTRSLRPSTEKYSWSEMESHVSECLTTCSSGSARETRRRVGQQEAENEGRGVAVLTFSVWRSNSYWLVPVKVRSGCHGKILNFIFIVHLVSSVVSLTG